MSDPQVPNMPAGWYSDPSGVGDARYWDGSSWTQAVSSHGINITAPIDVEQARIPPISGTEFRVVATPPLIPTPTYVAPVAPPPPRRSSAGLIGIIVALGLAAIAVIVLVSTLGGDDSDDPDPTTPTETPAPAVTEAPVPAETEAPVPAEQSVPAEDDGG